MAQSTSDFQGPQALPVKSQIHEWQNLSAGDCVEVWLRHEYQHIAYVNDRLDDGAVIWVTEDGTSTRRLYLRDDPVALYPA